MTHIFRRAPAAGRARRPAALSGAAATWGRIGAQEHDRVMTLTTAPPATTPTGEAAIEHVRRLLELFRQQPDQAAVAGLIELAEHLERAVVAFHMEAIRFRMFSLDRALKTASLPPAVGEAFDAVRHDLEAAGFADAEATREADECTQVLLDALRRPDHRQRRAGRRSPA